MLSFREKIAKNYINALGWSSKQKYLIIESDDWGGVRMPSKNVYDKLLQNNIAVDKFSFDKNDSLESEDDLKALYQVLQKYCDRVGNNPVLTAYFVVANPNFEKIAASNKKEYFYETILDTYHRFPHTRNVPDLINKGREEGLIVPQFHGREHIHVKRWMEAINSESQKELISFDNRAIVSSKSSLCTKPYVKDYFKGFDYNSIEEFREIEDIHRDGLRIFKSIFGNASVTFMAQGSVWGNHILDMLHDEGVNLICGQQHHPKLDGGYKVINQSWGVENHLGQLHWRRNCMFEPGRNQNFDWVGKCLSEIEIAFRWGKPAVLSSHRENYIGSIFEENREHTLKKLDKLFLNILKKWPDVQFISTEQLAEIMLQSKNK
jgi:hypothetical protein